MTKSIAGQQFGRLVALERVGMQNRKSLWKCKCDCGGIKVVRSDHLCSGKIVSCGCYFKEVMSKRMTTHGMTNSRVYRIWHDMINRCHYEKYPERHLYGGRGIKVCTRWRDSFQDFLADMGEPDGKQSIDRIDVNGDYEPGNCRWADASTQALNRRPPRHTASSRLITNNGATKSLSEWSRQCGLSRKTIEGRLRRKWNIEDALTLPPKPPKSPRYKRSQND